MFQIQSSEELEELSFKVKWQYFEKLTAFIFAENNYDVIQNKVITGQGTKRQFDVIAKDKNTTFLIECKRWKKINEAAIKEAIEQHIERCQFYSELFPEEPVYPLLVIPLDNIRTEYEDVPIIPITSLNWFINK